MALRLFTAIELPDSIKEEVGAICHGMPDVRWAPPSQLHLTLRFIGDTEPDDFETIRDALHEVRGTPFPLSLQGVGQFLRERISSVLWVGVEDSPRLQELYREVARALQRAGIPPEKRGYNPHITLTRMKHLQRERLTKYLESYSGFRSSPFEVTEFHLFSSRLRPDGAIHTIEESYPLRNHEEAAESGKPGRP